MGSVYADLILPCEDREDVSEDPRLSEWTISPSDLEKYAMDPKLTRKQIKIGFLALIKMSFISEAGLLSPSLTRNGKVIQSSYTCITTPATATAH